LELYVEEIAIVAGIANLIILSAPLTITLLARKDFIDCRISVETIACRNLSKASGSIGVIVVSKSAPLAHGVVSNTVNAPSISTRSNSWNGAIFYNTCPCWEFVNLVAFGISDEEVERRLAQSAHPVVLFALLAVAIKTPSDIVFGGGRILPQTIRNTTIRVALRGGNISVVSTLTDRAGGVVRRAVHAADTLHTGEYFPRVVLDAISWWDDGCATVIGRVKIDCRGTESTYRVVVCTASAVWTSAGGDLCRSSAIWRKDDSLAIGD